VPTQAAFTHLLVWLDNGQESGGATYLEMRRRLVWYFRRKGCTTPDDLADNTLNRVARRLEEEGTISDAPARYCYIVAKFVFLEHLRQVGQLRTGLAEAARAPEAEAPTDDEERRLQCLDRCLQQLSADDQALILEYYRGSQRERIDGRKALAARLSLSMNAVAIRACRIREKLVGCLRNCCGDE
jgi:DNA-directed RNA polymerase specialized sigma24 family protein